MKIGIKYQNNVNMGGGLREYQHVAISSRHTRRVRA